MATYKLLDSYTVGAGGASSVTFSNIPQTYSDLKIAISARGAASQGAGDVNISMNGGAISAYSGKRAFTYQTTVYSDSGTSIYFGQQPSASQTANTFGNGEIYITNYTSSNAKVFLSNSGTETNSADAFTFIGVANSTSTSAVTSITISGNGGNWIQNSTFYLYGIWADTSTGTPSAPTIGTATAGANSASVAFTPAGSGNTASYYQAISTPGSITGTATSSPITVSGLTGGASYTFKVAGVNPIGTGAYSASSNSITALSPAFEQISTVTIGAGGDADVTFSSIPSTYTHLQLRFNMRNSSSGSALMRLNGDATTNYSYHYLGRAGAATVVNGGSSAANNIFLGNTSQNSNWDSVYIVDILDYKNTSKRKTVRIFSGTEPYNTGNAPWIGLLSGGWFDTTAIDTIKIYPSSGLIQQYSTFSLYGIK